MKNRFPLAAALLAGVVALAGCSSNSQGDDASNVYLTVSYSLLPESWNVGGGAPLQLQSTEVRSVLKNPLGGTSSFLDTRLIDYVVEWQRVDGGTKVPEPETFGGNILIPAGGTSTLSNYEYLTRTALLRPDFHDFLAHMWGSQPTGWNEELRGWDRLRVIVNAMTRMRFCSLRGEMEFRSKGPVTSAPAGSLPWFEVPGRASANHSIVCGHWSALGLRIERRLLALDSGCLWGGALTAVRLEDREVFQLPCTRQIEPSGWD